jgi:hypothetical protein
MAIDLNDAEVKAAIQAAIDAEVAGLKAKNNELIDKVKKLQKGQEIDPQTVIDLEAKIDKLQGDLTASQKTVKEQSKLAETLQGQLKTESEFTQRLLIDNGLSDALTLVKVKPELSKAVKALFANQAQIKVDGDNRKAVIGDKALNEYIDEWSKSDEGKHFIAAPINGGGAAHGSSTGTQNKTWTRSEFDSKSHFERSEFAKSGGKVVD